MSMKHFYRFGMPGDYIVNDHIGSDSFRHVLPSQQHMKQPDYAVFLWFKQDKFKIRNLIPTFLLRYYSTFSLARPILTHLISTSPYRRF